MPGVYRRKGRKGDKSKNWTAWWIDENGKKQTFAAGGDKATAERIARLNDSQARLVQQGILSRDDQSRRQAAARPLADHIEDYRLILRDKGDTDKHARLTASQITRLLGQAAIVSILELGACDRIQAALGRMKDKRSPRTCNAHLIALKAFAKWLELSNRIPEMPRSLREIKPYNLRVDRRRVRRVLTQAEFDRLISTTEQGPDVVTHRNSRTDKRITGVMTGPERAALYQLAAGTGFRANELRSLTRESFDLDSESPHVVVEAAYSKRKRRDLQPIRRSLVPILKRFVEAAAPGEPVFMLPDKTADMLHADMTRAGIDWISEKRVADFHALRGAYITKLVRQGVDAATVQRLARHSDVRLTLQTYTDTRKDELRRAIEDE